MPGSWCWLSSGTKLGLWSDHLLVASPCGLGFLTTWSPQGTQMLTWCLGVPKVTIKRQPGGNYLAFYDQALELTWHSFHCGQNHSQMGGGSKSHCMKNTWVGYVIVASVPVPSLTLSFGNSVSFTPSHGPWCLTLFSQALCSPLFHHRGSPIIKEVELKLPSRSARKDDTRVLFGLFPLNISSGSENLLILNSRGPKNS